MKGTSMTDSRTCCSSARSPGTSVCAVFAFYGRSRTALHRWLRLRRMQCRERRPCSGNLRGAHGVPPGGVRRPPRFCSNRHRGRPRGRASHRTLRAMRRVPPGDDGVLPAERFPHHPRRQPRPTEVLCAGRAAAPGLRPGKPLRQPARLLTKRPNRHMREGASMRMYDIIEQAMTPRALPRGNSLLRPGLCGRREIPDHQASASHGYLSSAAWTRARQPRYPSPWSIRAMWWT